MNTNFCYVVVTGETDPAKQYLTYGGPNFHEMQFTNREKAKKYQPSTGIRVVECVYDAVDSGRPLPKILLSVQAVYDDGSTVVAGCPAPRYTAPTRKTAQLTLPEVPPVTQLADGSWRVTPPMQVKYTQHGQYFAVPYALVWRNAPMSGYFEAQTKKELFDSIFDTRRDAIADGNGGWLDPSNPQTPGVPTREQIFRSTLPIALAADVEKYLNLVAARDAAVAAAEAELYRQPTEAEIQAADARPETIARMPADVYKARYLSDKAFRVACDRREAFEKAIREKEQKEAAQAADRNAIDHGRKVLALREMGITSER